MEKQQSDDRCGTTAAGCGDIVRERNRYFTGKFMTARDFADEQAYFLSRRQLHNRLLHGWGIVCGLEVVRHPNEKDCGRWVVVRGGAALDCCGCEIVLGRDTPFELPLPPADEYLDLPFLLCLRYGEEEIEPVPALDAEGACDPKRREANRVRETAELVTRRLDEVEAGCWPRSGSVADTGHDDHGGSCLDPECPCETCVPLALIVPGDGGFEIVLDGRRQLAPRPGCLTRIAEINWPHGGEVPLSRLRDDMDCRLEVRFERRLRDADGEATGINEHTFQVQATGSRQSLEGLPQAAGYPASADGCTAVFQIASSYFKRKNVSNTIYVTLHSDFILDCHGHPVDADHLGGRLPSGNGTPGGTFLSWFRVVDDPPDKEQH